MLKTSPLSWKVTLCKWCSINSFDLSNPIISEQVVFPNANKRFRGRGPANRNTFAFVDLATAEEAQKALASLHESTLQDRKVSVKLAKPIVPRPVKVSSEPIVTTPMLTWPLFLAQGWKEWRSFWIRSEDSCRGYWEAQEKEEVQG